MTADESLANEARLAAARRLMQAGDFAAAARETGTVLADSPDHANALYMLAACHRYLGQLEDAVAALDRLRAVAPEYGRAWQERGHVYRLMGDAASAARAYGEAVRLNPALIASWRALADLHAQAGNARASALASEQTERLAALPRELAAVASMIHEGKLGKAEQHCRAFLQKSPHHIEGMRLLAEIGARLHVLDDAEFLLESAVEMAPEHDLARLDYVGVLHKRQKFEKALQQAEVLRARHPGHPIYENAWAGEAMAVGRFDDALAAYDRILRDMPGSPQIELVRGHALKTVGRTDEAVNAYRAAFGGRPDFGDAYWSLANLKTYRFSDREIAQMADREADGQTALGDRYHLCFALGKAHEDRGDFDTAFDYYQRGNMLKKQELQYNADRVSAEMALQKEICSPELFAKQAGKGHVAPDPIFIVGLPRAGSTLLEQILASHSLVEGTLELPNILSLAHRLNGRRQADEAPRYPAVLHELSPDELQAFGKAYIDDTSIYRAGAPFFTDKMPNNFRHIGLIRLILPNAKIIDARRDAMDCCFSGFKQLFAEGQEFTYGLEEIGRYYRDYLDLMTHWDRVLPGQILRVRHEDVIEDLEGQVRRLLDFCGLPFEEQCLDFHQTERAVRTASSEQVRQPVNRQGMGVWRRFEKHLKPLTDTLAPVVTTD